MFYKFEEIKARLEAIEQLKAPFSDRIASAIPEALNQVIGVEIHFDETFWRNTLNCSPEEIEEIQKTIRLHSNVGRIEKTFDEWFNSDVELCIQRWRGMRRIEMRVLGPQNIRESFYEYADLHNVILWKLDLSSNFLDDAYLALIQCSLESDLQIVARGGRFSKTWALPLMFLPPAANLFADIPLSENGLSPFFCKFDSHPWHRCYRHFDAEKGIAWRVGITDITMFMRSGGNDSQAESLLRNGEHQINEAVKNAASQNYANDKESLGEKNSINNEGQETNP